MKDNIASAWNRFWLFIRKSLVTSIIIGLAGILAYIQYSRNLSGGHAYTSAGEETHLWALTFASLLGLLGFCSILHAVISKEKKKQRRWLGAFIALLAVVLGCGGLAGTLATTQNADKAHYTDQSEAATLLDNAKAQKERLSSMLPALQAKANDLSASAGTRNAARSEIKDIESKIAEAESKESKAYALLRNTSVTTGQLAISGGFIALFTFFVQLCIELGFMMCCRYIGLIFGGQIRSLFNNLDFYDANGGDLTAKLIEAAQEDAQNTAKKSQPPASNLRDDLTVPQWKEQILQAERFRPNVFTSSRGLVRREAVRDNMEGGYSDKAALAVKQINQSRKRKAA